MQSVINKNFKPGLFIWVPKVAGTSVSEAFSVFRHFRIIQDTRLKSFNQVGFVTFGHVDISLMLRKNLMSNDFYNMAFKFSFVRNPYDRAISLFHWFRRNPGFPEVSAGATFRSFCEILAARQVPKIGLFNVDGLSQANPQSEWLRGGADFIGRFEALDDGFLHVCEKLGLGPVKLPWSRKKGVEVNRADYYDNKFCVNAVLRYYKKDFEVFGYNKDIQSFLSEGGNGKN